VDKDGRLKPVIAWVLYGIGHAIWWCFDRRWCGGMHWPIYRIYDTCMGWSDSVQGSGPGPWKDGLPE